MSSHPERPRSSEYADFYAGYVARVPDGDIRSLLPSQIEGTTSLLRSPEARERADFAYAPGKWTLKDVVGHLSDVERVLSYRALRIARADATPLAGFEEDAYVAAGEFGHRSLDDLLGELEAVRAASVTLFANLPGSAWQREGTANGQRVSVRACAYIIAGHELHHRAIIRERYLDGLS